MKSDGGADYQKTDAKEKNGWAATRKKKEYRARLRFNERAAAELLEHAPAFSVIDVGACNSGAIVLLCENINIIP